MNNTLSIIGSLTLTVGMVVLSVSLLLAVRTSRRAVKWNEQRTTEAVDRVVDRMITALADDGDDDDDVTPDEHDPAGGGWSYTRVGDGLLGFEDD